MKKDYKKELKHLYAPSPKKVVLVDVPPFNYLMIDGEGDPNTSMTYQQAIDALFAVSYALKFMIKEREPARDYRAMPLESLWWTRDRSGFSPEDRHAWQWSAMIMQPEELALVLFEKARERVARKKDLPALSDMYFEVLQEGQAAQIMHIGPYAAEGPTVERIHQFIEEQGLRPMGKQHEIYLSDPRRRDPDRLNTVIRQPCR